MDNAWVREYLPLSYTNQVDDFYFARPRGQRRGDGTTLSQDLFESSPDYPGDQVAEWAALKRSRRAGGGKGNTQPSAGPYSLITDPKEIRVLELLPGSADDPLRGSLHHCSVEFECRRDEGKPLKASQRFALSADRPDEPVWFTAISYCWGQQAFERAVELDGHPKLITPSLDAALRHFRHPQDAVVLWVDQLCINQDDVDEKMQQIPLMGRIYGLALNTVIWLGEADNSTASAFRFLDEIVVRLQYSHTIACPDGLTDVQLPPGDSSLWKDLSSLMGRPWFYRHWIIQEVVLSHGTWLMCGEHMKHGAFLSAACGNLVQSGISSWLNHSSIQPNKYATSVYEATADMFHQQEVTDYLLLDENALLFTLLKRTRNALCFEPRDKIYGLLAIAGLRANSRVRIDYTDKYPFTRLFHDVALDEVDRISNSTYFGHSIHRILSAVEATGTTTANLPSWVPNWAQPRQSRPLAGEGSSVYSMYHASGESEFNFHVDPSDDTRLHILANASDSILDLSKSFESPSLDYKDPASQNADLLACVDLCQRLQEYPGSCTVFEALWRSVVADLDETGLQHAPRDAFAEVCSVLLDASTGRSPSVAGQWYSPRQKRPAGRGKVTAADLGSRSIGKTYRSLLAAFQNVMRHRRFGVTGKGYVGLFPSASLVDDKIYVLSGCPVPYVMRRVGEGEFQVIGECYVHGIMEGEVLQREGFGWEKIVLV